MWRCYLCDTATGAVRSPIDIPSLSWSLTVSDASLSTTKGKGTGEGEARSVVVPWSAVPGSTWREKASSLSAGRRALLLGWDDGGSFYPVVFGAVGRRTDTVDDTSFSLDSVMQILASRYMVREREFYKGAAALSLSGLSLRAIAANVGWYCTEGKPGGSLPIDWGDFYEAGEHERTYWPYNVSNLACADIFEKIANVIGGPDIAFRPYMADGARVRLKFEAGSDADAYIGQRSVRTLRIGPGGNAGNASVAHLAPVSRVYATGAGSEAEELVHLAEDLSRVNAADPWPLIEEAFNDSSAEDGALLAAHADGRLAADSRPMAQLTCEINLGDADAPRPGDLWPGDVVNVRFQGFPTVPDGDYALRLMQMSGDLGMSVRLKFDPFIDPMEV